MYSLVSAIGRRIDRGTKWESLSIGDTKIKNLFGVYSKIFAKLTNNFITGTISFDLDNIRSSHSQSDLTFNQFLSANGETTLINSGVNFTLKENFLKYNDCFKAGYSATLVHPTASLDTKLPKSELTYGFISKPEINYSDFYKYNMVTVNGFIHMIDHSTDGIYIVDAGKSLGISNLNNIGLYCFADIGEITYKPITESMIGKQLDNIPLSKKTYIKLNVDMTNLVPIVVIGGYMHVCDTDLNKLCYLVNENTIAIDTEQYPFLDRYFESKEYIDLSSLTLEKTNNNPEQILISDLTTDENIKKLLTLSQSFIILLNPKSDIFVESKHLELGKINNLLIAHEKPNLPLITGLGRFVDYWSTEEDGKYSIRVTNDKTYNRHYNSAVMRDSNSDDKILSVDDMSLSYNQYCKSFSYFLKMGTSVVF